MTAFDSRFMHRFGQALVSAGLLTVSACAPRSAASGVATSICRRDDVLTFAAAHYGATNLYVRPASASAAETPTLYPDTVLCTIRVEVGRYDTARAGDRPQVRLEGRSFYVTKLPYGFRVRFDDG
jgi:hypothetical protein